MMHNTGQATLPELKSMVAELPGKTKAHNRLVSQNNGADGTFATELSAARKHLGDGTESRALDAASRRQRPGDASDAPRASADDVEKTAEKNSRPFVQEVNKDAGLNPSQQSHSARVVSEETLEPHSLSAQAEDKSTIEQDGFDITDTVNIRQIDRDADTATDTEAHTHARIVATADALSNAGAVIRNDAGQATETKGLLASVQHGQETDPERLTGLLPGKDDSIPRDKKPVRLQPLAHAGSSESLGQLKSDPVSRTKADDTTLGLVRGSLKSDGDNAGVVFAGLNPAKTLSGNTQLHSDRNPNEKTGANVALTESSETVVSKLSQAIQLDAGGKALPLQTSASRLADHNILSAPGNLPSHETAESAQVMATLKREALRNDGAERNAVALKTEAVKAGFNVEELLFQRSLSAQQTAAVDAPVNSDARLHQSNSLANMFHTFGSGILTAPVTARGLPESGMMMTAPTTVSLLSENAGNDIAGNIRWMQSEGLKSAVINVSPSGMGPISVKIGIEDEIMNVSFVALQGATRDALDSALPKLRDQLLSQGNESVRVDVSDGKSGQNRSGADGQFAENRQNQSSDNGSNSIETQRQIYEEQIPEVNELNTFSSDKLPGKRSGKQVVRYDLYV